MSAKEVKFMSNIYTTRLEHIAYNSCCYTDLVINKDIFIPFLAVGTNGVFIFIKVPNSKKPLSYLTDTIRSALGITGNTIYFFLLVEDNVLLAEEYETSFVKIDDIYEAFDNLYNNTLLPYSDLILLDFKDYISMTKEPTLPEHIYDELIDDTGEPAYIKPVLTDSQVNKINDAVIQLIENNSKIRTDTDGNKYVLRSDVSGLGIGDKKWYRLSTEDTGDVLKYTLIGGWFGLHKFKEGDIKGGILYALTCGLFGVGYVFDILSLIIGVYNYKDTKYDKAGHKVKDKVYYKPLRNKKIAIVGLAMSLLLSFLLVNTLYKWGYTSIVSGISNAANNYTANNPDVAEDIATYVTDILNVE